MEQIQEQILMFLQIIIGGIISVASANAIAYFKKKTELAKANLKKIDNENARNILNNTLVEIEELITTNIISAENTLKPIILKGIEDGVLDKDELQSLAKVVKEDVLNQLSKQSMIVLTNTLNDSNSYLEKKIERILAELKSKDGTEVNRTVIENIEFKGGNNENK